MTDVPDYNPFDNVLDEIATAEKSVFDINAAANKILDGFFMAAFTSDPAWNLDLSKLIYLIVNIAILLERESQRERQIEKESQRETERDRKREREKEREREE